MLESNFLIQQPPTNNQNSKAKVNNKANKKNNEKNSKVNDENNAKVTDENNSKVTDENKPEPPKGKTRGRKPGSKNKSTIAKIKEQEEAAKNKLASLETELNSLKASLKSPPAKKKKTN